MDNIDHILYGIPLFRHCTEQEILSLKKKGRPVVIPRGRKHDLRRAGVLYVVIRGLFEIEALGKNDIFYLSPGSFFGDIPFTLNRHRGSVKALVDSELLLLDIEEIYRFFLSSFKAVRGYLRSIGKMGFELSDVGKKYSGNKSRVITVHSPHPGSGKTLFSAYLGIACSGEGRTIILDMSYKGNSIFNIFEKKITHAISQRPNEDLSSEAFVYEYIEEVNGSLSLLNIAFGARVKADPGILAPILFILSREYRYIIIDLGGQDDALRDRIVEFTDVLFAVLKKAKDRELLYDFCDDRLREGQRVFYVLNRYFDQDTRSFDGGFLFNNLGISRDTTALTALSGHAAMDGAKDLITQFVSRKRKALVCEANMMESIALAGLMRSLHAAGSDIGLCYSSSLSYVVVALYMLLDDDDEYERQMVKIFSEDRINSLLDITFPDEHIISNSKIYRFARDIGKNRRIEIFKNVPAAMLASDDGQGSRIFSTGYFSDLITGSFLLHPVFEPVEIAGRRYHSGYPRVQARPENLLRTDVDEIIHASVRNRQKLRFHDKRILRFYEKYLEYLYEWRPDEKPDEAADRHITIEIDEDTPRVEKIMKLSEEISNKLLKENRI